MFLWHFTSKMFEYLKRNARVLEQNVVIGVYFLKSHITDVFKAAVWWSLDRVSRKCHMLQAANGEAEESSKSAGKWESTCVRLHRHFLRIWSQLDVWMERGGCCSDSPELAGLRRRAHFTRLLLIWGGLTFKDCPPHPPDCSPRSQPSPRRGQKINGLKVTAGATGMVNTMCPHMEMGVTMDTQGVPVTQLWWEVTERNISCLCVPLYAFIPGLGPDRRTNPSSSL